MNVQPGVKLGGKQPSAIPAWYAVKYRLLESLFGAQDALSAYRSKPHPVMLDTFMTHVIDLHIQLRPKIKKMKGDFTGLDGLVKYYKGVRGRHTDDEFDQFVVWYLELQDILEDLGVIKITFDENEEPDSILMRGWIGE